MIETARRLFEPMDEVPARREAFQRSTETHGESTFAPPADPGRVWTV
jgi:hypothetical protein